LRLTLRRRSPSRGSSVVVVGPARWVRRVLGLLQALLELAIQQLPLLRFGLHLLAKALLALGRLGDELAEGVPEALRLAPKWRLFVGDHGLQLGIEGELGVTAGAGDGETRCSHERHCTESSPTRLPENRGALRPRRGAARAGGVGASSRPPCRYPTAR